MSWLRNSLWPSIVKSWTETSRSTKSSRVVHQDSQPKREKIIVYLHIRLSQRRSSRTRHKLSSAPSHASSTLSSTSLSAWSVMLQTTHLRKFSGLWATLRRKKYWKITLGRVQFSWLISRVSHLSTNARCQRLPISAIEPLQRAQANQTMSRRAILSQRMPNW